MCASKKVVSWLLVTSLVCLICQSCYGLRILGLFPYHGKSHYIMGEVLMKALAGKGHRVDVYSHFPQKNPLPHFTDYSLAGSASDVKDNVTYDLLLEFIDGSASVKHWMKQAGTQLCKLMDLPVFQKLLRDPPQDPPYDIIISDICLANCFIAWSHYLNVPVIDTLTSTPYDWVLAPRGNPINYAVASSTFSYSAPPFSFYERLENFYVGNMMSLMFGFYVQEQDKYIEKYFGPGYPKAKDIGKDVALILTNYDHGIHGVRPFVPSLVPVGGMHIDDSNETLPQSLQNWLDESKHGFVYFSFGSMVRIETFPNYILKAFYEAFESISPTRVLWRIVKPEVLPAALPKNVRTEKWLLQTQILKHKNIRAFVTHGGILGGYEAIYHAVPMLGIPFFADQHQNTDLYVKKEIGLKLNLNEITIETFTRALNEIVKNPTYKQNIVKLSNKFKDQQKNPLETAIFWVEYIARHGRDALRSPIVDIPWWQALHLDLYCFIVGVIILAAFIIVKLWRALIKLFTLVLNRQLNEKIKKR